MTKKDVYVVVDTPKKAKKLKKLFDIFREPHAGRSIGHSNYDGVMLFGEKWCAIDIYSESAAKIKVSIKELRNILAAEHLKEGDYVVCEDNGDVAVGVFKEWEPLFGFELDRCHYKDGLISTGDCFDNFKRYATPEEISLLEPQEEKKELEVGKWYKDTEETNSQLLICVEEIQSNNIVGHGFDCIKVWKNRGHNFYGYNMSSAYKYLVKATTQEVEEALIKEAKRRYKVGDKVRCLSYDSCLGNLDFKNVIYYHNDNDLWISSKNCNIKVFDNGKWAEVIKNDDKFAELKEAHKNGAVIECLQTTGHWIEIEDPQWQPDCEYRIKPEDPVKVGDWMFNPNSKKITQVKKDNHGKSLIGSGWLKIKDKELIEKLNSLS